MNWEERICMVAIDLEPGEDAPEEFDTAGGVHFELTEVEDLDDGRQMAWYFQQAAS
jgi:hypothetical protein